MEEKQSNTEQSETLRPEQIVAQAITWGRFIRRFLFNTFKNVLMFVFTLVLVLLLLLQFSFTQTILAQLAFNSVSEMLGFRVQATSVYFDFFNSKLSLENLSIRDLQQKQMIFAEKLRIDFDYQTVVRNGGVTLRDVYLKRGSINLIIDQKTDQLNISQFIEVIDSLTAPKVRNPNAPPTTIWIQKSQIEDTYFSFSDNTKPFLNEEGIDYSHFGIDEMNVKLNNLKIIDDSISTQIIGLRGIERQANLHLKNLTTHFLFGEKAMEFKNLVCEVGNSILRKEVLLHFDKRRDLSDFIEKVNLTAHLDSTIIHTEDLAIFAPEVKQYEDTWRLKGVFQGKVNDFAIKKMDIYFGNQSHLHGDVEMIGLPDIEQTFMQFKFNQSQFLASELEKYIDERDISGVINKFGFVRFKGNFTGFLSDFVANGDFQTDIGYLESDINLKLRENRQASYYKGKLKTQQLDMGKLFDDPKLAFMDMEGTIEGTGFAPESARFDLDAHIQKLQYNRYDYQDIQVDGKFGRKRFEGEMIAHDENFNFEIKGEIDFNKNTQNQNTPPGRFNLNAQIKQINLQALNFLPNEAIVKGNIHLDTYGLSLDSLIGEAVLSDAFVLYNGKALNIYTVDFLAFKQENGGRFFEIRSEFFDFKAEGNFYFLEVLNDLQELAHEYVLSFRNDLKAIETYYKKKNQRSIRRYAVEFDLNCKNVNELLGLFVKDIYISKGSRVIGKFSHGKVSSFSVFTRNKEKIDSVFLAHNRFYDIKIDINTSKIAGSKDILAEGNITSKRQQFGGITIENTSIEAFWGDDLINFDLQTQQAGNTNFANLIGSMKFSNDTTLINFKPSNFIFLDEKWLISKNNEINLNAKGTVFKDLILYNEDAPESNITVNGVISDSIPNPLDIKLQNIELLFFADFLGKDIRGLLNSDISLRNLYQSPDVKGIIDLENLEYQKILIGDIEGNMEWDNEKDNISLNADIYRKGRFILGLSGNYKPHATQNSLDLSVDLRRTDLEILEPFANDLVSKLGGTAFGKLLIRGTLNEPVVTGKLAIQNGAFMVNYLKTIYGIEGDVNFTTNEILMPQMVLLDEDNNPATLKASIFHDGFKNIYLDITSKFYDFQLLKTTSKDNSLFYGLAYATGTLAIKGFLNNLQMDINARSKRGTKLSIPMDGYQEIAQQDYIRFVKPKQYGDTTNVSKIDLGGLKLNFNLDVTSDAEFEIIFDLKAGDIIRGTGRGNIDMKIDTEGDFNIFGYYVIQEGKYNFTFANLVNKGFDIAPGSRITFNGDMYESSLDIRALYNKNVSLKPLVDLETVPDPNNREYTRSYPVKALMDMKGKFLSPEIKLDLDLSEAKKTANTFLQTAVLQLENTIQRDEQERNRQVFSLLILNRLSSPNSFQSVGSAASSSLSELLSNQFSNWISQVDENLELSFDVNPSDFNSFQLRFSYSLLDGRLRITREGGFTNNRNQADFSSVFGDWTIEYLLDPNGKFRIKTYYRNNQNVVTGVNLSNNNTAVTGASLLHTANFNSFGELFKGNSEKKKAKRQLKENKKQDNLLAEDTDSNPQKEPEWEFKEEFKKQILIVTDSVKAVLMPLEHRTDVFMLKITEKETSSYTSKQGTKNRELSDEEIRQQYIEGDNDNEPMPEQYVNKTLQNTQLIYTNTENSNVQIFPFGHRFDVIKHKKKHKHK